MLKIKYNSTAQRYPETIKEDNTTVREVLAEYDAPNTSKFSVNGTFLTNNDLDMTLREVVNNGYASEDSAIIISETAKTNGAC